MKRDPESLLGTENGEAYRRFVEWSVGDGFDLAIIKMTAPVDRNALIAWTRERVRGACEIDLKMVGSDRSHLWNLLRTGRDEQAATMLMVYGLEESPIQQPLLAQLNVERDELVKAFAMPWVLFVHPAIYPALVDKAPDFVDFAGLWLEETARSTEGAIVSSLSSVPEEVAVEREEEAADEIDLVHTATVAIRFSRLDKARDLLARYEFRYASNAPEFDFMLARCLRAIVDKLHDEALLILREKLLPAISQLAPRRLMTMTFLVDILRRRGYWTEALDLAQNYLLPAFDRLGDTRARALTLGKVASVLAARGDLDEALRIRRDEVLSVYEKLGDSRECAVSMGKIADILTMRGELDEALSIYRKESLVYEGLGESRSRAITIGKIADILARRGDIDEALRIRREDELPVYEKIGDLRGRALTLGKIADILQTRGELDEALHLYRDEQLPVFERLGDTRSRAVVMGEIANIFARRGEREKALLLYREEVLPVFERLGDVRSLLAARMNEAWILIQRGRPEDRTAIEQQLGLALREARRLRVPNVAEIEGIIRDFGGDPNAPPYVQ